MLLHRVIFKEIALIFSLCVGTLLVLMLTGRMLQLRELLITHNLDIIDLLKLFFFLSPFFLQIIIPIGCMLAVFLTMLRMSTDREIIALKTGGVGLYKLQAGPILFCLLMSGATLFISLYGVSWGMDNFKASLVEMVRSKGLPAVREGVFSTDIPGVVLYAGELEDDGAVLKDVVVGDKTQPRTRSYITAPKGRMETDPDRGEIVFTLEDGSLFRYRDADVAVLTFGSYVVRLSLGGVLKDDDTKGVGKPKEMSWDRLKALAVDADVIREKGASFLRKVRVEIQKRFALPAACMVLGLFAMSTATAFQGLARHWGLILAVSFFLLYYTLFSLGLGLGEAGSLPPFVGLWTPNLLFFFLGLWALKQTAAERHFTFIRH